MGPLDLIDRFLLGDDSPASRRKWRLSMGLSMLVVIGHMVWALNMIPGAETGYDTRTEQAQTERVVARIERKLLEKDLLDTIRQRCEATDKRFLSGRIRELKEQWWDMTGQRYNEPNCDEV